MPILNKKTIADIFGTKKAQDIPPAPNVGPDLIRVGRHTIQSPFQLQQRSNFGKVNRAIERLGQTEVSANDVFRAGSGALRAQSRANKRAAIGSMRRAGLGIGARSNFLTQAGAAEGSQLGQLGAQAKLGAAQHNFGVRAGQLGGLTAMQELMTTERGQDATRLDNILSQLFGF